MAWVYQFPRGFRLLFACLAHAVLGLGVAAWTDKVMASAREVAMFAGLMAVVWGVALLFALSIYLEPLHTPPPSVGD